MTEQKKDTLKQEVNKSEINRMTSQETTNDKENKISPALKEMYTSVTEAKNQVQLLINTLDEKKEDLVNLLEMFEKKGGGIIKNLEEHSLVLFQVPKKVDQRITEMVPKIATRLDKIFKGKTNILDKLYQEKLAEYNDLTESAANKLIEVRDDMESFAKGRKKKFFFGLLMSMLFAGVVSAATSYALITKYPTKVFVSDNKDVVVKNSEVTFWGSDRVSVQDIKNQKKKK